MTYTYGHRVLVTPETFGDQPYAAVVLQDQGGDFIQVVDMEGKKWLADRLLVSQR